MTTTPAQVTCLACGVFRDELKVLAANGKIDVPYVTFESMLHMNPAQLDRVLSQEIDKHPTEQFVLIYGDCCPHMRNFEHMGRISRTKGVNCCEIMLGKEAYRRLQQEKAFIFLPEWAMRWREIFSRELGFTTPASARTFLQEHLDKLVYLDTGVVPVPEEELREIEHYFAMPLEIVPVSLETFRKGIIDAVHHLRGAEAL